MKISSIYVCCKCKLAFVDQGCCGHCGSDLEPFRLIQLSEIESIQNIQKNQRDEIDESFSQVIKEFNKLSKEDQAYVLGLIRRIQNGDKKHENDRSTEIE